jgi:Ca2+-binding EF-hand superfamily protein
MKLPAPQDLAKAIAQTSFSDIDKRLMLLKIRTMDKKQIIAFYEAIINLNKEEETFINAVQALDLQYQMKFQEAYADSMGGDLNPKRG